MAADPRDPVHVGSSLTELLGVEAVNLTLATTGYETYCWVADLAAPVGGYTRVVLRVYPSPARDASAGREEAVLRFLASKSFEAPRPIAAGDSASVLGLPFVVMSFVPGSNVAARVQEPGMIELLADTAAALHALPIDGWGIPPPPDLAEGHDHLAARLLSRHQELAEASAWIQATAPSLPQPEKVSILHGDLAPSNVLVDDEGRATLVDWATATPGDHHSDLAYLLVQLEFAGCDEAMERRLLERYQRSMPVQPERLRFFEAVRCFGMWCFAVAAQEPGLLDGVPVKPELLSIARTGLLDVVRPRFHRVVSG